MMMMMKQSIMFLNIFLIFSALSLKASAGPASSSSAVFYWKRHSNSTVKPHRHKAIRNQQPMNFSPSEAPTQGTFSNPFRYRDKPSRDTVGQRFKKWKHRFAFPHSYSSSGLDNGTKNSRKSALPRNWQGHRPLVVPSQSSFPSSENGSPPPLPLSKLPSPPPNQDCASVKCTDPLTHAPHGSRCACVLPIAVELRLSITLYAFFPLLPELSREIAASIPLKRSQVRIMGANAIDQHLKKTTVLVNLVPEEENFNSSTALAIYDKLWKRKLSLNQQLFGSYEVAYVRYPGLPPSPPSSGASIDSQPFLENGSAIKPLGVDVSRQKKDGIGRNMITIIVLSSVTAFVVFVGLILVLSRKLRGRMYHPMETPRDSPQGKASGSLTIRNPTTMSMSSSISAYAGTAKVLTALDIEKATDNFNPKRILGKGGFGLVYSGVLEDGRNVAVKILKRGDRQGGLEFLAEVEMLSRLHHRNLVKLIGICTEDHCRCLVYELVPNGSVESHLHGVDKKDSRLDWYSRVKIALGAAQGLAYLHEDSNPRVIHRDFKSSNILLEHDFTPKVSDFGLARAALDEEGNQHISTHVMGTFGYLAPEYAMTGHLLVKSDVYSYGVVLLELLTGRKPIDLSQPPGQENLVAWACPLLTTEEGLEMLIDPAIKPDTILFDSVIKFAAIAAMCVQPEASHRPFMGEVVQALKLICNEFDEMRELMSRSSSQEELCVDLGSRGAGEFVEASQAHDEAVISIYDSSFDAEMPLAVGDLKSLSDRLEVAESGSIRREFYSAPLRTKAKRNFRQLNRRKS